MGVNGAREARRATAETVLHPVRLRIVQALDGRQLTVRQLGAVLEDIPQASLYRHLQRLQGAGLVRVAGELPAPGGVQRTYALVSPRVTVDPESLAAAGPAEHLRYFATFTAALVAGFERYLRSSAAPDAQGSPDLGGAAVRYRQLSLWLSPDEASRLDRALLETLESFAANGPAADRRRFTVATVRHPDACPPDSP